MTVPAPILAGVPGSFPHSVFTERHPVLIDRVLAALPFAATHREALRALLDESLHTELTPLPADAVDASRWREWGAPWWGRPWGEAPFLWAESYFYRRLLEATGWFRPGVWQGVDPFGPAKAAELTGSAVDEELAALDDLDGTAETEVRDALLLSALWGNRADLGFRLTSAAGGSDEATGGLLVDDRAAFWAVLEAADAPHVCVIADNAGRELLPDLILADHLLDTGRAARVTLHLKPRPYYVSDATGADLVAALRVLLAAPGTAHAVGQRLWHALESGHLIARTHEFYCAPLPFQNMPGDLADEIGSAAMTICKGDLNYRRLVGDRHWPSTVPFTEAVGRFPSPVTALRTLKSDVAVGLSDEQLDRLDGTGAPWRTTGEYALIQCAIPVRDNDSRVSADSREAPPR